MRLADLFSASLDAGLYYALSGLVHTTRLTRGFDYVDDGAGSSGVKRAQGRSSARLRLTRG